jgi:hypothetical protein
MAVTDRQVATLRAQLAGDLDEHKRLLAHFDEKSDALAYVTLTNAAFFEAVDRRFNSGTTADDISDSSRTYGHGRNRSGPRWALAWLSGFS